MFNFLFYQAGDKLPRDFEVGHMKISWAIGLLLACFILGGMNEYHFCTNYNICE